ncbi:MAG: DEAD/DEAH box helicase [Nitrosopumilus sp. B06]|nr:MAG: DEAD/DEAH box helicase [Nitrosopumilus sp. B06]
MKIEKLVISDPAKKFLKSEGYEKLYPPQADSVKAGVLKGTSILVSAPTASGKTLIAMLAMMGYFSRKKGRVVYLSPLRALASEKYTEFKKLEKILDIRVGVTTGESEAGKKLDSCNVIILTNERMDSLIRRGSEWIDKIGLVIADEVHLIGEENRGPTLEMVLTQLKLLEPSPQIVGLSATITNSDELAEWLGCKLVENDWRPVNLTEGVCTHGEVVMNDGTEFEIERTSCGTAIDLGIQCVADGGQSLVFASTRPSSKSLATKAMAGISNTLSKQEILHLSKVSKKILAENEHTDIIKTLAALIPKGVAFHHAGLNQNCRTIIETEFRRGGIKLLTSTPTLAAGVNLPARRVVISSVLRYDFRYGRNMPISVLEYKQFCGRAGRPQYDEYGEAIIVDEKGHDELYEHYVEGEPEPIESHITSEKSLRIHALSVISSNPGIQQKDLLEFFLQTFGGYQESKSEIKYNLEDATEFLLDEQLIITMSAKKRYSATPFGKKTSMLYLDPLTAVRFRNALQDASPDNHTLGYLHLISESEEFYPRFSLRLKDSEAANKLLDDHTNEMLRPISIDECSRSLLGLYAWISEYTDLQLSERLGIESGDMHRMRETGDWLAYCLHAISLEIKRADLLGELDTLRTRIKNGIKKELLELVRVRGIGRARSRRLYRHGIKNLADLEKITIPKLAEIDKIGPTLASSIKAEMKKVKR